MVVSKNPSRRYNWPRSTVRIFHENLHPVTTNLVPTDLYATIGCHPTRSSEFDKHSGGPSAYLNALDKMIEQHMEGEGRVVAVGECGLGRNITSRECEPADLASRL